MDEALAAFSIRGRIDSKLALDVALTNLTTALQESDNEISTLLHTLVHHTNGLLEAVITSRNDGAFTFRSRILRILEKSSHHPHPIFLTCAERVGAFLISLPPWITLDPSVLQGYNALSTTLTSDNPEAGDFIRKKEVSPVRKLAPKPQKAAKSKKKKRFVPLSLAAQDPPGEEATEEPDSLPESPETQKRPLSPNDIKRRPSASEIPSKQLIACLGAYFTACIDDAIEEFALDELFKTLGPTSEPLFLPQSSLEPDAVKDHSPISGPPTMEAVAAVTSKPHLRPLLAPSQVAASLADSMSLQSGEWQVVVSQKGIRQFQQYASDDRAMLNRVKAITCQLSEGTFSPSNYLEIVSQEYGIPIYTANLGGGQRLVYQIDFGVLMDSRREAQFIRIFGVYPTSTINTEFWRAVSTQLAFKGPTYIQSCVDRAEARKLAKGARSVAPSLLPHLDASKSYKTENRVEISELHLHELHRLLSSEKYIPVKPSFFDAIHKFSDSNFMFAVSSAEDRIIKYPSSCLIMGRSGTGKTTCMIFRMIKLNLASEIFGRKLRQVFVTHSRTLARRVRMYCTELMQTEMNQPGGSVRKPTAGPLLLDMDESAEEDGVLPLKFSQLQDSHFPLCLNFDQLCGLLEADFNLEFNPSPSPTRQALRAKSKKGPSRDTLISFEYFHSHLWAHFDQRLKKGLHPALVYSEFMGIIKGSESTLGKPRRCLSREEYEDQTNRSLSGESTERARIYTLFEAYQKLRPPFSYDTADRVQTLINVLRENGVPGLPIDFLYVDEGQDNLIIDAALLRSLCSNPYGLFFAGDTAQTISVGSAFRFSELKAFLYRLERDDVEVKSGARQAVDPHFFQLSTNYRSHGGIVQAAAFIVHLLTTYFPHSIDPLAPEVPHVDISFHKPLFFSSHRSQSEFLRLISGSQSGEVELGAHQVIIVRDEAASARLRSLIDQAAIVLTIYESKGMEFDDVVLYDFFDHSSATKTDWRAMLLAHQHSRTFDGRRHTILQSELKALYVGLTRAKQRVWIWDQSEKSRIVETLLVGLKLAESHEPSQEVPRLGVSASPEEWDRQAQQYFSKSLFAEARFCFRKAGMTWWADVARAYGERQAASKLSKNHSDRSNVLAKVATNFDNLARQAVETEYPENIRLLFLNSAEAYAMIPDHAIAAELFLKALKYTESAYHYRMAGLFDEAIEVVKRYTVDPSVAERILYAAKIVLAKRGDMASLHKAWHLCESKVQFLEFLQDNGFGERRVPFLESIYEYEEAGQLLWKDGNHASAILRFDKADTSSSRHHAAQCLREGIAEHVFFATNYGEQSDQLSQLFNLSEATWLSADAKTEVEMFQAVTTLKTSELQLHGERCLANGDIRGAMLTLDAWIASGALSGLAQADDQNAAELLLLCRKFAKAIKTTAQTPGLIDSPPMRKLFGITSPSSNYMSSSSGVIVQRMVLPQSFIYSAAQDSARRVGGPTTKEANPVALSKNSINSVIRNALLERLNRILSEVDLIARKSRAFGFCTRFLTVGRCSNGGELCWRDHVHWNAFTVMKFNSKLRLHLLLIALLDEFVAIDQRQKEQTHGIQKKIWATKIFDLCYPSTNKAGNLSDITPALIPEYTSTIPIVQRWLHDIFHSLQPITQARYFFTNLLTTSMLATAFNYESVIHYLKNAKWSLDGQAAHERGLLLQNGRSAAGIAIAWFDRSVPTRINLGIYFLDHLVSGHAFFDAEVGVAFAEELCGQLILNHYAHNITRFNYLTMPRSWIIRGFARTLPSARNGSTPWRYVAALDRFLSMLLLKENSDRLYLYGSQVRSSSPAVRSQAIGRLCRCLALVGVNITGTQGAILAVFGKIRDGPALHPEFQQFVLAQKWPDVMDALQSSLGPSSMDETYTLRQGSGSGNSQKFPKIIYYVNENELLGKLQLNPHLPAIIPQSDTLAPEVTQSEWAPMLKTNAQGVRGETRLKPVASTPRTEKGALIIQAFFRRCGRRAGGPIAAAYDQLALKLGEKQLDPKLRLCLLGPLPHVLEYLQTLKAVSDSAIDSWKREMQASSNETLDNLHIKGLELREIHDATNLIIEDLQPSSAFYLELPSNSPLSVLEIVEKVRRIPGLVTNIKKFAKCPKDSDYNLGVEPLLSDRVSWTPEPPP